MQNIQLIFHVLANGKTETLSFICSLQYTVDNGTTAESNNIKVNASHPYTQNRMIHRRRLQCCSLGKNREIVKVKSTTVSAGISKYLIL